jgi:hypothetical protein
MTLPIPKDINFEIPKKTEKEFFDSSFKDWQEDEDLIVTGEWNDVIDDVKD